MKRLIMKEYADFECIGGECPDTCCCGWMVEIDAASVERYKAVEGEFGDQLRQNIKKRDDGRSYFEMQKNGRCPFLNKENLCRIYRTLGPEAMCETCQVYPREIYCVGDIQFAAVSISCPEAGRLILGKNEKAQYAYHEDEDESYDADTDWDSFNQAVRTYSTLNGILQEREFFVRERIAAALIYACQMQEMIAAGMLTDTLTNLFHDPDQYAAVIVQVLEERRAIAEKLSFVRAFISAMLKTNRADTLVIEFHEILNYIAVKADQTEEIWLEAFKMFDDIVDETEAEQLLVYLMFRHFMEDYKKRTVWESTVLIVAFYSAYRCLTVLHYLSKGEFPDFEWRVLLVARVSRLFEHTRGVWDAVLENMKAEGMDQLGYLLHLVN